MKFYTTSSSISYALGSCPSYGSSSVETSPYKDYFEGDIQPTRNGGFKLVQITNNYFGDVDVLEVAGSFCELANLLLEQGRGVEM